MGVTTEMAVGMRRLPRASLERYGKRLLMALGLSAPILAWSLWDTVPGRCYEAVLWEDPLWFCGLLFPELNLLAAGLIVLVAFAAPSAYRLARPRLREVWSNRVGGER